MLVVTGTLRWNFQQGDTERFSFAVKLEYYFNFFIYFYVPGLTVVLESYLHLRPELYQIAFTSDHSIPVRMELIANMKQCAYSKAKVAMELFQRSQG